MKTIFLSVLVALMPSRRTPLSRSVGRRSGWGICPRIIQSWIENNDLTGKRIIPFATSGSSSIDGAVEFLRKTYPQYNWQDGLLLNSYTKEDLKKLVK